MSHKVIEEVCIGCGGCEYACSVGALSKTDSFLGLFVIDPFTCNDCGDCVTKCPESAIVVDPEWAVCGDRGCPLSSSRLADVECAFWQERCPTCGSTMWRREAAADDRVDADGEHQHGAWVCSRCDLEMKVACPRANKLEPVTFRSGPA